jgi:hypothetical protein
MKGSAKHVGASIALATLAISVTLSACGGSGSAASSSPSVAASQAAGPTTASPSPSLSPTMSPVPIPVVKPGDKMPPFSKLAALYEYDRSEPFNVHFGNAFPEFGVTIQPTAYAVAGRSSGGYIVMPDGEGPFPVVVYAPGSLTGVEMWFPDAATLAKKGYAGLLLADPGSEPLSLSKAVADGRSLVDDVIVVRRGLDLLQTMPKIDASRIGFVAWSNGSRAGGFLSGLDNRVRAFVLVGLNNEDVTTWGADFQRQLKAKGVSPERYAAQMSIFDPALYFSRNKDAHFLFMWGNTELVPIVKQWYLDAAPRHSTLHVFLGGHEVNSFASKFLDAWIVKNL